MRKGCPFLKYVTLIQIVVLAAAACCVSALPPPARPELPKQDRLLRYGQSLALADFDGDHRIDDATLRGTGRHKSIDIRLSQTKTHRVLYFDVQTDATGALFAGDVDDDGDNDLVWSDLLHPQDVIVWLDDGTGRFERAEPDRYAKAFVLTAEPVVQLAEIPHQDLAFSSQTIVHLLPSGPQPSSFKALIHRGESTRHFVTTLSLTAHTVRGPPFLI
jgi:hypothetical protein